MKTKILTVVLATSMLLTACAGKQTVYEATVKGHNDNVTVSVELEGEKIKVVNVKEHSESKGVSDKAIENVPKAIVEQQSLNVDTVSGATVSSTAIIEGTKKALVDAGVNIEQYMKTTSVEEVEADTIFAKGWDATPELGITKGDYFKEVGKFGRGEGHTGILEVVINEGNMVMIEFNEFGRPDYHTLAYADYKRLSDYNFMMGEIGGTAWVQGVLHAEQTMLENQDLTVEIDYVSGASETISQGLQPLAQSLDARLAAGTNQKFYRIAEDFGNGVVGNLDVIVEDGKIVECKYDEIFAASQDAIEEPKHKKYYRTSKYENNMYKDDSKIGFRWQMDKLNERVVETQDLFNIAGLPAAQEDEDAKKNPSYDQYLMLAEKLHAEMMQDKVIK